jgi:hypothetical protein
MGFSDLNEIERLEWNILHINTQRTDGWPFYYHIDINLDTMVATQIWDTNTSAWIDVTGNLVWWQFSAWSKKLWGTSYYYRWSILSS